MKSYAKTHEWAEIEGRSARVGISDFAASELGDIVFVSLPEAGAEVKAGEFLCEVESVKAVSEIMSPVSGTVTKVNSALEDAPEAINEDAECAWICVIDISEAPEGLMTAQEYEAFIK